MYHLLDLLVIAFVFYGVRRGRKRGLYVEIPGAVSAVLFFLTGWGLFKIMYRGVAAADKWIGLSLGIFTFLLVGFISFKLWMKVRGRIRERAEKNIDPRHKETGGAIAGGVWAFTWACILILILAKTFLNFAVRGSFLSDFLIAYVLPVYEKTHQ